MVLSHDWTARLKTVGWTPLTLLFLISVPVGGSDARNRHPEKCAAKSH